MSFGGRGRGGGRRRKWGANGFEEWGGYMAAKKSKLQEQFSEDAKVEETETGIFAGVAIFVNGYTDPSADDLKRIMMTNGGVFHHYLNTQKTTHIIATNLPDVKVKALKGNEPICHPQWITESLKAGKLLDFRDFLLYSNVSKTQPKLPFKPSTASSSSPSKARAKDATDSNFLGEFYNNSRLHHISTMGAEFKRLINELRDKHDGSFPERQKLKPLKKPDFERLQRQIIMHIDMDCFFVSVGLRKHPELVGKPVAVTHAKGNKVQTANEESRAKERMLYHERLNEKLNNQVTKEDAADFSRSKLMSVGESGSSMSEIASCSYEARAAGVKNGMFLGPALELCPDLKTIPYDFEGYLSVANELYNAVAQFTLDIQAVSCDEMLVDLTDLLNTSQVDAMEFASFIRNEIYEKTGCSASVGLGTSLLLARMATKKAKPNGQFFLAESDAKDFMGSIAVRDLPGVGRMMGHKLKNLNVESCADLQQVSLDVLQREFGNKTGQSLHKFCRGIDDRKINFCQERKSVSAEVNYGIRFSNDSEAEKFLDQLSEEVHQRMVRLGIRGRCVTLKVMVRAADAPEETAKFLGHGVCDSHSKSSSLSSSTNETHIIKREVLMLLRQLKVKSEDLRGIGIQVSRLDGNTTGKTTTASILNFVNKGEKEKPAPKPVQPSVVERAPVALDPEFLAALPEDIQKELKAEYGRTCEANAAVVASPIAGPSRSPVRSPPVNDVSFSQLDPTVLAELPPDVREEVRMQYQKKKEPTTTVFDKLMTTNKSPLKTPPKRKRGRPGKFSPRNRAVTNKGANKEPNYVRTLFSAEMGESPEKVQEEEIEAEEENTREPASLMGRRHVSEVRPLLREWIRSMESPTDDDLNTISEFFQQLVQEKVLNIVYPLLKTLRRLTDSRSPEWRRGYELVEDAVQSEMKIIYGKELFTSFT